MRRSPRPLPPLLVAFLTALGGCGAEAEPGPADYRRLWEQGRTFPDFLASVESRTEEWDANRRAATVPDELVERARRAQGPWRLLIVADDWCGDSVWTVPWVARLAEAVEGLEVRLVVSNVGRAVMRAHPTPDGRAASPTMVLLDEAFEDRGCFVERPPELQRWYLENPDDLPREELLETRYDRYRADAGRSTLEEVVAMLEAAHAGGERCSLPEDPA